MKCLTFILLLVLCQINIVYGQEIKRLNNKQQNIVIKTDEGRFKLNVNLINDSDSVRNQGTLESQFEKKSISSLTIEKSTGIVTDSSIVFSDTDKMPDSLNLYSTIFYKKVAYLGELDSKSVYQDRYFMDNPELADTLNGSLESFRPLSDRKIKKNCKCKKYKLVKGVLKCIKYACK